MTKLNQIIAIEKGIKSKAYAELSELNKMVQKEELFTGFSKTYNPKAEDGESLPPESKRVQLTVDDVLRTTERALTELMTVTARKDWTNTNARADVVVDDNTLLSGVPVTYLLFLEKQVTDIRTFIGNLPVLDLAEDWNKDDKSGLYKTGVTQTHRTKKTVKPVVLYPATAEHPAQTQLITEDVIVGFWNNTKLSGGIESTKKQAVLANVEKLLTAIKEAREAANSANEIDSPNVGVEIFNYLFEGVGV